jgi:hypothetical protein
MAAHGARAPFTRQRPQVRNLSRPPAQTVRRTPRMPLAVSRLSANHIKWSRECLACCPVRGSRWQDNHKLGKDARTAPDGLIRQLSGMGMNRGCPQVTAGRGWLAAPPRPSSVAMGPVSSRCASSGPKRAGSSRRATSAGMSHQLDRAVLVEDLNDDPATLAATGNQWLGRSRDQVDIPAGAASASRTPAECGAATATAGRTTKAKPQIASIPCVRESP